MSLSNYIEKPQTELFDRLGVIFAFSNQQFDKNKKDGVQYAVLGCVAYCPADNVKAYVKEHGEIISNGIAQDLKENGVEAIIRRELANYECYYVGDYTDAVEPLESYGITELQIKNVFKRGA